MAAKTNLRVTPSLNFSRVDIDSKTNLQLKPFQIILGAITASYENIICGKILNLLKIWYIQNDDVFVSEHNFTSLPLQL